MKHPYQWLLVLGLLTFSIALGVSAYREPAHLDLIMGGNDGQFIRNTNGPAIVAPTSAIRWLRGHSVISIAGLSANHPYTLSMFLGGDSAKMGNRAYYTIIVNGYRYPAFPLTGPRWRTWRIEKDLVKNGELNIVFSSPTYLNMIWYYGLSISNLKLTPATDPGQVMTEYSELDWRNVAYLAAIALLAYSFFAAVRRWLMLAALLASIIVAVVLANLLATNRPLFVVYASSIALGLLLLRLALPMLVGSGRQPRLALWLFLLTLAAALLFALPDIQSGDNYFKYLTAESLLLRGSPKLPSPILDLGNQYSRYALGHSIADLPLLAIGWAIEQLNGATPLIRQSFVNLLNPILSAIGVALLFLCARRLFSSERLAAALSLIYFFATFALVYAVQDWTEPLLATLLLFAFYSMLRVFAPLAPDRLKWLLIAGFALGYMLFTKEEFVIVVAIFGLWWLLRRGSELRRAAIAWHRLIAALFFEGLRLAAPVAAFYALDLSYNYLRNGTLFASSYINSKIIAFDHPLLAGLYGLLFSSGKGLVVFAPPVLLCLWAAAKFWCTRHWEAGLIGVLFSALLIFYSVYFFWDGGSSWGPRFLLPFLPLLMLVSGAALQSWPHWRPSQRWLYAGLVVAGAVISVPGLLTPFWGDWIYGYQNQGLILWGELSNFSPFYSPIAHAWEMLWRGYVQPFAMFQLSYYHFPAIADHLVPGLLIALIGVAAVQVARIYATRPLQSAAIADEAPQLAQVAHVESATAG
ncbi:MAG: hypothetical protein DLM69_05615 [Candidatus Chloroheliales bacterium]|nr:MAG: hypothetical protein DLM69_05615 [Chloroflexota bacterium]